MGIYEKRITVQIPHNMRMVLGILADAEGCTISTYCRRILESFVCGWGSYQEKLYLCPRVSKEAWERVAYAWKAKEGPDAEISIRLTKEVLDELDYASVYNRSALIRTVIQSHIFHFMPKLDIDIATKCLNDLKDIIKKHLDRFRKQK